MIGLVLMMAVLGAGVDVEVSGNVLSFSMEQWDSRSLRIQGLTYHQLSLPGEALFMKKGAPSLPKVCRSLMGPLTLKIMEADYYEVYANIPPSKGSLSRSIDPEKVPYVFGREYGKDAFFPETCVKLKEPYVMRDVCGQVVEFYPFQYNPVSNTLRIYTSITVEVKALERKAKARPPSRAFERIYKNHFINYQSSGRYVPLDESGGMLIICHDPWLAHIQPFVEYKNSIGITTMAVGVSNFNNDPMAIRQFIRGMYFKQNLSFVLLVGDAEQVASPQFLMGSDLGSSDPTYSLLDGNDNYPEIMVGRFSAENLDHLFTQIERTINYEMTPANKETWYWRGMGVASDQGPGDDGEMDDEHIENIRKLLLANGYSLVDQIYDPNANAMMVSTGLENGRGIVNYCGHGGSGGWGSSAFCHTHLNALLNQNMLPFIFCVACSTGHFEGGDCIGESFLRATQHNNAATGGIGYYGGSLSQYWSEPMEAQDEFNNLLIKEEYACLGTLCYGGSCSMMDKYGQGGADMFLTWHLFGDPSLRVVKTVNQPTGVMVSPHHGLLAQGAKKGPFLNTKMSFTLNNKAPSAQNFVVNGTAPWVQLSPTSGVVPANSQIQVKVSINEDLAKTFTKGHYESKVVFYNSSASKIIGERMVCLEVGAPMPAYCFDLNTDPGWSRTGEWQFGKPRGQGAVSYGYPDPLSGATGTNVFGVNLNGDYDESPGGPFYLTTHPINCEKLVKVSLNFMRWLNSDFQPYFFSTLEVSNNNKDWTLIWENPGAEIAEHAWKEQAYDISAVANRQPTVYIRWGYEKGSPAYAYSGWNIDDVEIWGVKVKQKIKEYKNKPQ